MIQMESLVQVADNTGARSAKMIGVIGKRTRQAHIGDIITCHIRESIPTASVKKGTVEQAVVVRTAAPIRRDDGSVLRFDGNAVVIIDKDNNPRGTRIFGPVARELREKKFIPCSGSALTETPQDFERRPPKRRMAFFIVPRFSDKFSLRCASYIGRRLPERSPCLAQEAGKSGIGYEGGIPVVEISACFPGLPFSGICFSMTLNACLSC